MSRGVFLGIETSGTSTGLAIIRDGSVVVETTERSECGHNETLIPLIKSALDQAGVSESKLSGIGVTIGPGMFTSLRVGLSVVKGLALARRIPVKGIGTLPALALSVPAGGRPVLAVVDARKGQVYAALYASDQAVLAEPCVVFPGDLVETLAAKAPHGQVLLVAGTGSGLVCTAAERGGLRLEQTAILPS
jgi:tRNA threonylcarbamoyladenosine biosynthesis protein TsaB